jgi:hypothetical protein
MYLNNRCNIVFRSDKTRLFRRKFEIINNYLRIQREKLADGGDRSPLVVNR